LRLSYECRRVFLLAEVLIWDAATSLAQTDTTPGSKTPGQGDSRYEWSEPVRGQRAGQARFGGVAALVAQTPSIRDHGYRRSSAIARGGREPHEPYISNIYRYNYAKISLVRALGISELGVKEYFKGK
jgi:ribosomal protein L4